MKKLKGIITPLVTLYDEKNEVNLPEMGRLVEKLISQGVDGIFLCGTTAESPLLSLEERKQIAEYVFKIINNRVPVYIQAGGMSLKQTLEYANHAISCKVDGIAILTPSYYKFSQDDILEYYLSVANSLPSDFPIYIYSIPECTGNDVLPETAKKIAEKCPNVIGIKYSGDDMLQLFEYTLICDGHFSVLAGHDRGFIAVLEGGCDGIVSGMSHVFQKRLKQIYDLWRNGEHEKALAINKTVLRDTNVLLSGAFLPNLKAAIEYLGFKTGGVRPPFQQIAEEHRKLLIGELGKMDL